MANEQEHIRWLDELGSEDTAAVGGKSANLGELTTLDVPVLPGFTTTAAAYDRFIETAEIESELRGILADLDVDDVSDLRQRGERVRDTITGAELPDDLRSEIVDAYIELGEEIGVEEPAVAARSSATAEDLPTASFAGQQETYLDVSGAEAVVEAVKKCYASLFTDRAIAYREDRGFDHFDVKLATTIQKMGRADRACSGVLFTIDPDSGFEGVVVIEAAYGLGELIVQGEVDPDRYVVFKETNGIVEKELGEKDERLVQTESGAEVESVPTDERGAYALSDDRIHELTTYGNRIEDHYDRPMDVEWLVDAQLDEIFIVQARPETVHSAETGDVIQHYDLKEEGEQILEGLAIGTAIADGEVSILQDVDQMDRFEAGEVLVTGMTDPDWVPIMKRAGAIVTDRGGKTSHAAIVSRELGVPAIVGTREATDVLADGQEITIDCTRDRGRVYDGILDYEIREETVGDLPETDVKIILGDPSRAFSLSHLPVDGVGLAREEFIVSSHVGHHPLALIEDGEEAQFVEALRTGIAKIAAAFYPNDVVVRLSDFKTDEYRDLHGGEAHEPQEDNPMIGWRGASRYYDDEFKEAFRLECEAFRQVREDVGLDNLVVLVPFCRTPAEGEEVIDRMRTYGLPREDVDIYVMAEVPSNIILADRFAEIFEGFSIGSNDLTQLTLGVDRNSERLAYLFDESDEAVTRSIRTLIEQAHRHDRPVGICGDAPSTIDGYVEFLMEAGIDSISVSPDRVLETVSTVADLE